MKDISCRLETGQLVVLMGANGSGKSTLAKVLTGIITPESGTITLNQEKLQNGWRGVGYLLQNCDEQFLTGNVEREIAFGLENQALSGEIIEQRVEEALDRLRLHSIRRQPPERLSDAEKQLTAFASVWAMKAQFIILDEATAYLDPAGKRLVIDAAQELRREAGILWITSRRKDIINADELWILENHRLEVGVNGY
ncbi:MAG: energy-coupling factor ABC transporter ATP-binding protein [Calditrichota bacterium]